MNSGTNERTDFVYLAIRYIEKDKHATMLAIASLVARDGPRLHESEQYHDGISTTFGRQTWS